MPSPRYTVRLPPALDAQVQARVRAGTPFAVLIREALAAYLADTPLTSPLTGRAVSTPTGQMPTAADRADTLHRLEDQLRALTRRVERLEQRPRRRQPPADRRADTMPTGRADRAPTPLATPGTVINEVGSHEDMLPTLLAAAGDPDIKDKLLKGFKADNMTYKVHLDGYNLLPALKDGAAWPRKEFLYWTDDGDLAALRYTQWKLVFLEQRAHGFDVWQEPFVQLRVPKLFSLRADPFERADHEGMDYSRWRIDRVFLLVPAQAFVVNWLQSFREFPPRQKPASFGIDQVMEKLTQQPSGSR